MLNQYRIEFVLFTLLSRFINLFGYKNITRTSHVISFIVFHILKTRRNVVLKNLQIAFPNLNASELKKLAYKNFHSSAITFLEMFGLSNVGRQKIDEQFILKNKDLILSKLKEDKGLIFLTAHYGNWEMGAIAIGVKLNEAIHVLVKEQKNPYVANWLRNFREKFGNVQITLGVSVRDVYKALKEKRMVGIVGDQRGTKKSGVKVSFFGKETLTFPGTAALAFKIKCPVIVILCARQPNGQYHDLTEILEYNDIEGDEETKIKEFNQRYMNILESAIKKYPEQWFWMHNIWKY